MKNEVVLVKKTRFPKVFIGWWMVLSGGLISAWGAGYHAYGFSALFKPIASELGLNRAVTSVAASIGRFEGGFEAPITGWITDRYGPRVVILVGILLFGLGLILMNFITSTWTYYLIWGVIVGTGFNIAGTLTTDLAITNWFVKKRGLALGIKWTISGLGGSVVLPFVVARLIVKQGWRIACIVGGLVMLLVGFPLAWFFLKPRRPEYYGLLPDGAILEEEAASGDQTIDRGVKYAAEAEEVEFTFRQAMRTPAYWLLIMTQSIHSLAMPVVNIHGIPFLTDIGIEPLRAAGMLAIMILAGIPPRFIGGFFADRVKKHHLRFLIGGAYFFQTIGFVAILQNQNIPMIYTWLILYGIGYGAAFTLNAAMRARYFGRKAFGSIAGLSRLLLLPVGIAAPVYIGWVFDTTGSYISAFSLVTALLAFSAVTMSLISPPKPPAEVTDIRKIV